MLCKRTVILSTNLKKDLKIFVSNFYQKLKTENVANNAIKHK